MAKASRPAGKRDGARGKSPRAVAARLIWQMEKGRSLSELFATELDQVAPRDRPLVKEICFGVARWWPQLEALGRELLERPLKPRDAEVKALIYVGLYQMLHMRTADYAAVKETVDAARSPRRPWAMGLVNGVLRRFQREQQELLEALEPDESASCALPHWLLQRLKHAWPAQWLRIAEVYQSQPPMSLRINLSKVSRQSYFAHLSQALTPARPIPGVPSGLVLDRAMAVEDLPGFEQGEVSVQDGGAQLAAGLLDLKPGLRVLDACAAPGGKSCHILESAKDISLVAVDIDAERLPRIEENLQRIGVQANVCQGDASRPEGAWAEVQYDRILLDVPCSATGVIRRHPDIKLLRRDEDIAALTALQAKILDAVWPLLKSGGMLVYATCSLLPEENSQQVERFLQRQAGARVRPIDAEWGHPLSVGRQTMPGEATMDGFYYACLEKTEL